MRLRSLILGSAFLICGCPNAADKNLPANPVASAPVSSPSALPIASATTTNGPSWHWVNPKPQGNALNAIVANAQCGVIAVGEQSTVMRFDRRRPDVVRASSQDRYRYKAAALLGTIFHVVGDTSDDNVILSSARCGNDEPVTIRKLDQKSDGAANGIAIDSEGRLYVSTVRHAEGKMLCSKPHGLDLSVCDDQPKTPFYGLFVDKSGRVLVASGYQGADGGMVRASSDHGATWKTLAKHLGSIAYGIVGDTDGRHLLATSPGEIHASNDRGATWKTSPVNMMSGGSMMLGTDDAPYIPNDFDSFVFGADSGTFFVTARGVLRGEKFSTSAMTSPTSGNQGIGFDAAVTTGNGHWVGVGDTGFIARSTDDGKTWNAISHDGLPVGDSFVDLHADASTLYVLRRAKFIRSDDGGASFVELGDEDAPDPQVSTRDNVSFAIDHDVVVLPRPKHHAIARSTDRGKTFTEFLKLTNDQNVVHVWSGGSGLFYASGTAGALFKSSDDGATFTPLAIGAIQDLAAGVVSGHDVYLVGSMGASSGGFFIRATTAKRGRAKASISTLRRRYGRKRSLRRRPLRKIRPVFRSRPELDQNGRPELR